MTCIWHILPISKVLRRLINHNLLHIAEFQRLLSVNNNPGGGGKLPVTGLIFLQIAKTHKQSVVKRNIPAIIGNADIDMNDFTLICSFKVS